MIEGDEYDCAFFDKRPKFVHYLPNVAIIGNVEFDHADIYPDLAAVQLAFVRLMNVVPRSGLLVAGTESPALVEILPKARCRVETFGLHEGADWRADGRADRARRLPLPAASRQGRDEGEFTLRDGGRAQRPQRAGGARGGRGGRASSPGRPRRRSPPSGASSAAWRCGARRGGVTVYDDFAHHPTAVAATLAALRALGGERAPRGRLRAALLHRARRASSRTTSPGPSPAPTG